MNAHKIILCSLAFLSVITIGSITPTLKLEPSASLVYRMPADNGEGDIAKVEEKKVEVVSCKSELKGEKLEAEMKKLIKDKELVLKEVEDLKKEKTSEKLSSKSNEHADIINLMSQLTSMISLQMQSQMQLQLQMMTMLTQSQNHFIPQMSPFDYQQPFSMMGNTSAFDNYGIGLQPQAMYPQSPTFQSPYSMLPQPIPQQVLPQMFRQPAQAPMSFPIFQGFDFNQSLMNSIPQMSANDLMST